MTQGAFWDSAKKGVRILKKVGKLEKECLHQVVPHFNKLIPHPITEVHEDLYNELIANQDYDILMDDYSIFQFNFIDGLPKMVFLQNPRKHVSLDEYLISIGLDMDIPNFKQFKYDIIDEYSQFRNEQEYISSPTYFRYDVDSKNRINNENIHAYAHLHVGLNNSIRIPVGIDLNPLGFVLFVLRHVYYDKWVEIIRKSLLDENELIFKSSCGMFPPELWTDKEKQSLYLS